VVTKLILLAALPLVVFACGSDDTKSPATTSTVPATVERAQFCALYDKLACEVNDKCCAEKAYATTAACVAAAPCSASVGPLLESAKVVDGTIRYDAKAAGDYLRDLEARKSACARAEATGKLPFLTGTVDIGGDCTTVNDAATALVCKPGTHCAITEDVMMGKRTGACAAGDDEVVVANVGATCASDEDCRSSTCVASKCAAPSGACVPLVAKGPPSNGTPTQLGLKANSSNSGAGTSGAIKIGYAISQKYYECTIPDGIGVGETKFCNVSYTSSNWAATGSKWFTIEMKSEDGLLYDKLYARDATGATIEGVDNFMDFTKADCTWCLAGHCDHCWLDADGHGNCTKMTISIVDNLNTNSCNN
jgi:hypothetical protein